MRTPLFLLLVVGISVAVGPAAAQRPSKALLPRMVLPDASLVALAGGLGQKFEFFSNANDGAASSPDPKDTGADLRRLGRIAGYVRGRNAAGAFSRRGPERLQAVGTSAILWRDARAAAASIERDTAAANRLRGKPVQGGFEVSFAATKASSLGAGAMLWHLRARQTGGTDRFTTQVVFRVGRLRGNAIVGHGDNRYDDAAALQLADQLRRRMLATLHRK
jgi:hypothetical protein